MIADVPVGVFLSGGYDSTAVTALLQKHSGQKIKTFTIGFEDARFNEAHHAKNVAEYLGTEHYEHTCTHKDALDIVTELPYIFDEPFGDISAIPTTLVSRMARQKVTVALSADGGDEIFAGYPKFFSALGRINSLNRIPSFAQNLVASLITDAGTDLSRQNKWSKLKAFFKNKDNIARYDIISQAMTFHETQLLLNREINMAQTLFTENNNLDSTNDLLAQIQAIEYKTYLADDILQKVDRATMSTSLEGREPFLDQRIIEFVARLPSDFKYRNGVGKAILKDIVHKYVPKEIMERPKMGFDPPLEKWLRNELKGLLEDLLNEQYLKNQNIFNVQQVMKMKEAYLNDSTAKFERIGNLFLFQLWFDRWMK
jgi:asparagine synthase (glutamine-hydrolysing)